MNNEFEMRSDRSLVRIAALEEGLTTAILLLNMLVDSGRLCFEKESFTDKTIQALKTLVKK